MSHPQHAPRSGKVLTPALITALAGLLVLAVVTVVVVLRAGDDPDPNAGTVATSVTDSATSSAAPAGDLSAEDDSFSYAMPNGFEDAMGKVPGADGVAMMYAPETDPALPTTIIVSSEPAYGASIDEAVTSTRGHTEKALSASTETTSTSVTEIDGEPAKAFISGEYDLGGEKARTLMILAIHDDTLYGFVLNVSTDNLDDGTASLEELVSSITWND